MNNILDNAMEMMEKLLDTSSEVFKDITPSDATKLAITGAAIVFGAYEITKK